MRAVVLRNKALTVENIEAPRPAAHQVLVTTIACGICGSDLHFVHHGERMAALSAEGSSGSSSASSSSASSTLDFSRNIVMGHEFVGRVEELGPDAYTSAKVGELVVSIPVMMTAVPPTDDSFRTIGYSNEFNGGYAEQMLLSGPLLLRVPNALSVEFAALTEPMAVGLHAVNKSGIVPGDAAVVHGCGPVGLAVIAALRLKGIETIIASDFSPKRRDLATVMGATQVIDTRTYDPMDALLEAVGRPGVRTAMIAGSGSGLVQFECVGVPGMINTSMKRAPRASAITVVGACMESDSIQPMFGISKELSVSFVLGYTPEEFAGSLRSIAEGEIDVAPLITGVVGLDDVATAFSDLANPELHAKILVRP
jgi:threonine dehydrogenase-like Zn-dependent dehydrogenase